MARVRWQRNACGCQFIGPVPEVARMDPALHRLTCDLRRPGRLALVRCDWYIGNSSSPTLERPLQTFCPLFMRSYCSTRQSKRVDQSVLHRRFGWPRYQQPPSRYWDRIRPVPRRVGGNTISDLKSEAIARSPAQALWIGSIRLTGSGFVTSSRWGKSFHGRRLQP